VSTYRWSVLVRLIFSILAISVLGSRGAAQSIDDYTHQIGDASVGRVTAPRSSSDCDDLLKNDPQKNVPRPCQENLEFVDTGSPQFTLRAPASTGTVSAETLRHALSGKALRSLQKALGLIEAGDHIRALEQLHETAKISSAAPYAYSLLGQEHLRLGKAEEAIPELQQAVSLLPSDAANRADLGLALLMTGDSRAALRLDPNNPHTQLVLGIALLGNGTHDDEGIGYLRAAERRLSAAHMVLAAFYARAGRLDVAEQEARAFLGPDRSSNPAMVRNWIELMARQPGTLAEFAYGVSK
jgi:tetratricopeptide (TPR) repeat protein